MKKGANYWYFLIPLLLFLVQLVFTLNSFSQVRQEELSESISYPFWLSENRIVCNGITTAVGWFAAMWGIYEVFGFHLFAGRYFRLAIALLSYFCLAALLRRKLGTKLAVVPLLTLGLSPTLLYFNSLQETFGIDLQIFPICLYLLDLVNFKKLSGYFKAAGAWFLAMFAWMSYPAFIYYLPILGVVSFLRMRESGFSVKLRMTFVSLLVFLAPLVAAFAFIKNKSTLIYDPSVGSGIFRGNGDFNLGSLGDNLRVLFYDLFVSSVSYYFQVAKVEFSNFFPIVGIILTFFAVYLFFARERKVKNALLLLVALFLFALILGDATGEVGGIRRVTVILAIFYIFFCYGWYYIIKYQKAGLLKNLVVVGFSLILVHHVFAIGYNLESLKVDKKFAENQWFYAAETPQKSFDMFLSQIQKADLALVCTDGSGKPVPCGGYEYNLIYPALLAACKWNDLSCHNILIYDFKKQETASLKLDCWTTGVGI